MILHMYLFVRLTSSAGLQPHLTGEERESQQVLQHRLPCEQSPFFWQGLFISRFWLLAGVHRPKTWEEDITVELGFCVRVRRSLGRGGVASVILCLSLRIYSCDQLCQNLCSSVHQREHTHTVQPRCHRAAASISRGRGAAATISLFADLFSMVKLPSS